VQFSKQQGKSLIHDSIYEKSRPFKDIWRHGRSEIAWSKFHVC